jgi:hypothetical protein
LDKCRDTLESLEADWNGKSALEVVDEYDAKVDDLKKELRF